MTKALQLLMPVPCWTTQSVNKIENKSRFSSAVAHLASSFALAIIIGVGVSLAIYFSTHHLMGTGLAGAAGTLVSGFVTYVIFRCTFGSIRQTHRDMVNDATEIQGTISPERPFLKGVVYIASLTSGRIRQDRKFEFAKRLKRENGEFIQIDQEDIYLKLHGKFENEFFNGTFTFQDKKGLPNIYLPAALFVGIKEGETIRFFYEDKLIELTCSQAFHPVASARGTFEGVVNQVKKLVQFENKKALWFEDVESESKFMENLIGQSHFQINCVTETKTSIEDFKFYEEDQKKYGEYKKFVCTFNANGVIQFDLHKSYGIDISEIHLIESQRSNEPHQFWILLPHNPRENQFPEGSDKMWFLSTKMLKNEEVPVNFLAEGKLDESQYQNYKKLFNPQQEELIKKEFNPEKGDRLPSYHYGQYFMCSFPSNPKKAHLCFNEFGWLLLSFTF